MMEESATPSAGVDPSGWSSGPARIIVGEASGRWAVALRRELGPVLGFRPSLAASRVFGPFPP